MPVDTILKDKRKAWDVPCTQTRNFTFQQKYLGVTLRVKCKSLRSNRSTELSLSEAMAIVIMFHSMRSGCSY